MKKDDKASISLQKVIAVGIILIFLMGITVFAVNSKVTNVKIILSNGYEITVLTSKTKVSDILDENHIILLPNEQVTPNLEEDISDNKTIRIYDKKNYSKVISEVVETKDSSSENSNLDIVKKIDTTDNSNIQNQEDITVEKLLAENYNSIIEKIITEQIVIPYETKVNDISKGSADKKEVVITKGIDGLKEVTKKIKYKDNTELESIILSENIVKQPTTKVVEIRDIIITSRSSEVRTATTNPAVNASTQLAERVADITPTVRTMNTSGYCACASCCGKTNGITSSGAKASEWYTLAAGSGYPIGTVIYIPYFANKPNGGWFVVQDRGGAISNSSLDVFFGSHSAALSFGRRNLECYVYQF